MTARPAPAHSRRPLLVGVLLACGLAWGSTQSLGKIAVSTGHGHFGLLFWQFAVSAGLLLPVLAWRGKPLVLTPPALAFGLVIALVGTLLPGITFYMSIERLPAGIMSILIATVPMMAFPIALALGQDRLVAGRVVGLLLGLVGVALLAGPDAALPEPGMAAWIPFALLGPLCYAIESNFVARVGMGGQDPVQAMTLASLIGAAMALPLAIGSGQWIDPVRPWGPPEWSFLAMAAVNIATYVAYVWLAAVAGAVFAAQMSYVVTASGLVWASALLGERFPPLVWAALALLLTGLLLVAPREREAG